MGYRISKILDRSAFTSDLTETNVRFAGTLDHIGLGYRIVQAGATSPTFADLLNIFTEFTVRQGGTTMIQANGNDIFALSHLAFGQNASTYVLATADNEVGHLSDIQIPCFFRATDGAVTMAIDMTDNTESDAETITLLRVSRNSKNSDRPLSYVTSEYTASGTGAMLEAVNRFARGEVVGILFRATTIPTVTNQNSSVSKVQIRVAGVPMIETNWEVLGSDSDTMLTGDSNKDGILDNHKYLNLADDPIPAKTQYEVLIESDVADAVRVMPLERLPAPEVI